MKLGPVAALKHAAAKLPSYSLPPLVALCGAAVFAVQLAVLGVLMRLDFFVFLAGLVWPFVLMLGLLMAILLLGRSSGGRSCGPRSAWRARMLLMRSAEAMPTRINGRFGCFGMCCLRLYSRHLACSS